MFGVDSGGFLLQVSSSRSTSCHVEREQEVSAGLHPTGPPGSVPVCLFTCLSVCGHLTAVSLLRCLTEPGSILNNHLILPVCVCVYLCSGVKGQVFDGSGAPVQNAVVEVKGRSNMCPFRTNKHGEYYRLLLPGNYSFTVSDPATSSGRTVSAVRLA